GLYDLSGNVWEWCQNKYEDPKHAGINANRERRTLRGNSWFPQIAVHIGARAASRSGRDPDDLLNFDGGFRVVVVCRSPSQ
ncbi:MAG: SUMF1/EgtB/PvdO family nonheme iron enzyme, partial [Anaerolineales bacterium]|nr:SUMF1/EgtB/PvdO family nonheme iron enzyme [Anaerolineales bacterium]